MESVWKSLIRNKYAERINQLCKQRLDIQYGKSNWPIEFFFSWNSMISEREKTKRNITTKRMTMGRKWPNVGWKIDIFIHRYASAISMMREKKSIELSILKRSWSAINLLTSCWLGEFAFMLKPSRTSHF